MDPNENLKQQLELARLLITDDVSIDSYFDRAEHLADLVLSLHDWINKGGALPDVWIKNPK
jgi:hypothetical protein